jgi:hypothetical protein
VTDRQPCFLQAWPVPSQRCPAISSRWRSATVVPRPEIWCASIVAVG